MLPVLQGPVGITPSIRHSDMGDWVTLLHFLYLCVYVCVIMCVCYLLFNQGQESDSHTGALHS